MPVIWKGLLLSLLVLAGSCLFAQVAVPASPPYHQSVALTESGKPSLQLTNDSKLPMVAFFMVEFPSLGMEGRTYYDYYVNQRELPVTPGASIDRGLSSFQGAEGKVRAEVRGAIFQDGSTAGDPVWVNAILARRVRFYDRTLSLYDLLERQVGTGISREDLVALLRAAQAEADKQLPEDNLRVMDDLAFYGAISTIDKNRKTTVETILQRYLGYLRLRAAQLKRSRPALDTVRALPVAIPEPLSDDTLPSEFRASRAALASSAAALASNTQSPLSYCEILPQELFDVPTPTLSCSQGIYNQDFTFSAESFTQYNAITNTRQDVFWSSPADQGPFHGFGVCYGPYTNCSNDYGDYHYIKANADGSGAANQANINMIRVSQGQTPAQFYWMYDQYPYPTDEGCDQCDPNPGGTNPSSKNVPVSTPMWAFDYACTVH